MGFWKIMNMVAWGLCGLITYLLIADVIRVEMAQLRKAKKQAHR